MEQPIVYSMPNCFRCKNLKTLLEQKGVSFTEILDVDAMEQKGINHVPMMEVSGKLFDYDAAINWVESEVLNND